VGIVQRVLAFELLISNVPFFMGERLTRRYRVWFGGFTQNGQTYRIALYGI